MWPHSPAKYVRTCVRAYRVLITYVRTYVHGFAACWHPSSPGKLNGSRLGEITPSLRMRHPRLSHSPVEERSLSRTILSQKDACGFSPVALVASAVCCTSCLFLKPLQGHSSLWPSFQSSIWHVSSQYRTGFFRVWHGQTFLSVSKSSLRQNLQTRSPENASFIFSRVGEKALRLPLIPFLDILLRGRMEELGPGAVGYALQGSSRTGFRHYAAYARY